MATRNIRQPGDQTPKAPEETPGEAAEASQAPSALPALEDIDPTRITRSVLTQGGWVCPA
jgi:hypothetical protein